MKHFFIVFFLGCSVYCNGQSDTLTFTSRRGVANTVYGLLSNNLYGVSLIDRSLSDDTLLIQQIQGNYSSIGSAWSWLHAYTDIAVSYLNENQLFSDSVLIEKLTDSYEYIDRYMDDDIAIHPFGLLLHRTSKIEDSLYLANEGFSNFDNQLKLNPTINEQNIYRDVFIKEVALLKINEDDRHESGAIIYNPYFISVSPDIRLISIMIDVGNGFENFSSRDSVVYYQIIKEKQIGKVATSYMYHGQLFEDTLQFYITTGENKTLNRNKSKTKRWDITDIPYPSNSQQDLKYAVLYGCGNGEKIRRPIIFSPPYRPNIQIGVSLNDYFDQFNFASLFTMLSQMGYDVIFIKETPGNRGIDHAGNILAGFIKYINVQKKINYPNEDWENVVVGFSAGGQHWRWALKILEKQHMDWGTPHHHTRLYIPFDSPHWGANVPMFAQSVFKDFTQTGNIPAALAYNALKDAASKDMLMNHIIGSNITLSGNNDFYITPAPTSEKIAIDNQMMNDFNHQFTPLNDLRRSFPSFTRNVAISTGNNTKDYETEYTLNPGMQLFSQNFLMPTIWGIKHIYREIDASWYLSASTVLYRKDIRLIALVIPVITQHHYLTDLAYEWDEAQGGHKDDFFDNLGYSPIAIMRWGAWGLGTKNYAKHMSFLPMVSALAINPQIWKNNNLYFNLKNEGLMFNKFDIQNNPPSNTFGYPNLAHPNNHFNITPFEAVYCDQQTYEHIKMQASVDNQHDHLNAIYLAYTRDFILDEVEASTVYLQNKVIGKNHIQWDPNYRYKAWYKATDKIVIGSSVTPKTDVGPYIIEKTGDITVYACNEVVLSPGFYAQNGASFHAFIRCDGCGRQEISDNNSNGKQSMFQNNTETSYNESNLGSIQPDKLRFKVYPNPSSQEFTIEFPQGEGEINIVDLNGKIIHTEHVIRERMIINLPKGVYILKWENNKEVQTQKIIAL